MILTFKHEQERKEADGSDLPMFSRSGKSTISQYLSFSKHQKNKAYGAVDSQFTLANKQKQEDQEL